MAAPLRGTQSLVEQMGWVFRRPALSLLEIAWRWTFAIPLLIVCWMQLQLILRALPLDSSGLSSIDPQNPWVAAVQLTGALERYRPYVAALAHWLFPLAALAWAVISGLGRSLVLSRLDSQLRLKPLIRRIPEMMLLQGAWLALLGFLVWLWFRAIQWDAAMHISATGEPDLVAYCAWAIFLSLAFFTLWSLVSWTLTVAPLVMLLERRSALSAVLESLRLGRNFSAKLMEINFVMGIVKMAVAVLAMVLSAAPLPFSDQIGSDTMHWVYMTSVIFYLVVNDYFHVVRLKSFVEFWKSFRGPHPS